MDGHDQATNGSTDGLKLVGFKNFVRNNPMAEKFPVHKFHHIEFWTSDATNTYKRFQCGLGMTLVAKSDQSTGNTVYASYVLKSNDLVFAFTAPYSKKMATKSPSVPLQSYSHQVAHDFLIAHGLAVRSVGLVVDDAAAAYSISVAEGARPVLAPVTLTDEATGKEQVVSEVELYGDVVLRYVSGPFQGPFLAGYVATDSPPLCYGIQRLDHAVGNVHNLLEAVAYIIKFTGFHEFAEFLAEDVGTADSGLNSMVLASNNEMVLLPINEPTFGTKRKSQIQTYLEQNEGPGLQHLALKTNDIVSTLRAMQAVSNSGGFEFMPRPEPGYYERLKSRVESTKIFSAEKLAAFEELGILVDRDDQGLLLQIFTKPLGDRPTVFVEIIERVCLVEADHGREEKGGCGGFGKGNFSELFKSIEDYEKTLDV